ncbi:MAG: L-threonine 3-dehydrogenase, partial [Thermoleophilia bacterium]|nr:L-threonine 3-dehydrogenase [Thermoleophilia bacterium]
MKALVKARAEPGLWLEEVAEPEIGINDVLIRVRKTGICGTDLHIHRWDEWAQRTIPVPLVIGHEFVGEIVEVGSNVSDFNPGDVVSGEGHVVCGRCRNCMAGRRHLCAHTIGLGVQRSGAFAEYVSLPMTNIWHHWPGIPEDAAAIFDPFGNAVHTALAFPVLGEDVLVTGAGPIGCMAAAVARHAGARHVVVTELNPYRRELAGRMGATLTVDPGERDLHDVQRELGMTEGFDVALEMSGAEPALRSILDNMAHGGRVALLGIPSGPVAIDFDKVVFDMLTIKGIYGREMYETWYQMSVMLQSGLEITP